MFASPIAKSDAKTLANSSIKPTLSGATPLGTLDGDSERAFASRLAQPRFDYSFADTSVHARTVSAPTLNANTRPAPVNVRSGSAAVAFLQRNNALAATIDADTVFVLPEYARSRAVLAHEYAHVAQLRSGLTASRKTAEATAERVAAGQTDDAGGAAPPPLFQKPSADAGGDLFSDRAARDKLEEHDLPGARVERKTDAASGGDVIVIGSHADVSGSRADGMIVSRTDVELQFFEHAVFADPKQTKSPKTPPNLENVLPPVPGPAQTHQRAYPIVVNYRRSIVLTDRAGHDCDLHADYNVYFTGRTWKEQLRGRTLTLDVLTSLRGDFGRAAGTIASRGLPASKVAGFSNGGSSIDQQTTFAQRELSRRFVGHPAPADFLRAPETAGAQYDSLEKFLAAAAAPKVAPHKPLPPATSAPSPQHVGPLQVDERTSDAPHELPGWLKAIDALLAKIGGAIAAAWDALPWQVRSAIKVIAITAAAVAVIALVLYGAAELIVAGAAGLGVTLAVGTVFKVLVAIVMAVQLGRALVKRIAEAQGTGVRNPARVFAVSVLDSIGIADVVQAFTDRSLLSNEPLKRTNKERFESGLAGTIQFLTLLIGGAKARGKAPVADVPSPVQVPATELPAEPPSAQYGAGAGADAPATGDVPQTPVPKDDVAPPTTPHDAVTSNGPREDPDMKPDAPAGGAGPAPSPVRRSLLQQAVAAGARDELDETAIEVFAHGTTANAVQTAVASQGGNLAAEAGNFGGRLFTVPDAEVARVFAARTAGRTPGQRAGIFGVALPRSISNRLRAEGLLKLGPIDNPPPGVPAGAQEWVFEPGALGTLRDNGFFFEVN